MQVIDYQNITLPSQTSTPTTGNWGSQAYFSQVVDQCDTKRNDKHPRDYARCLKRPGYHCQEKKKKSSLFLHLIHLTF